MKVMCVLTASEVETDNPDIIVFPEGVDVQEIDQAQLFNPNAIIIGAIAEHGCDPECPQMRGMLRHEDSKNKVEYLKVETDGRTKGSSDTKQSPIYEFDDVCIGLLICMDIENIAFSKMVIDKIISSPAKLKLLCVPADMGSEWLGGDNLPGKFKGVYVILCNHSRTHESRYKSFIADIHGRKIRVQNDEESICEVLP